MRPITKPECRHGSPCVIRKVNKEGLNKDRRFFCCSNDKENSCRFFEWIPDETTYAHYRSVNFFKPPLENMSSEKPTEHYLTTEFINDFANNLNICFLSGVVKLYVIFTYVNKVFHLLYLFCCVCNGSDLRRVAKKRR